MMERPLKTFLGEHKALQQLANEGFMPLFDLYGNPVIAFGYYIFKRGSDRALYDKQREEIHLRYNINDRR